MQDELIPLIEFDKSNLDIPAYLFTEHIGSVYIRAKSFPGAMHYGALRSLEVRCTCHTK
jgi:hypothetical protein